MFIQNSPEFGADYAGDYCRFILCFLTNGEKHRYKLLQTLQALHITCI